LQQTIDNSMIERASEAINWQELGLDIVGATDRRNSTGQDNCSASNGHIGSNQ
jgi:hypothetical protein